MTGERIVLLGAGGHAREVAQILLHRKEIGHELDVVGFVADGHPDTERLQGLPLLGGLEWLGRTDAAGVSAVCAVGTPDVCRSLVVRVRGFGLPFARAVSPSAWLASTASVGEGSMVFPNVVVNADAVVGDHVTLNVAATVSHDGRVGDFCSIGPGAHLAGNVMLGEGCFVGMGAAIIQGVSVGDWSVVAAGATVLDDVPPGVTVAGTPARVVGPASLTPLAPRRAPALSPQSGGTA